MALFSNIESSIGLYPETNFRERYEALKTEFQYMSDFMLKGYNDPQRHKLYASLRKKVRDLEYDIAVRKDIYEQPYLKATLKYLLAGDTSTEELQSQLLATTNDPRRHNEVLTIAFHALLASYHWKEQDAEEWLAFLISSHTPSEDAATLISAITISCLEHSSIQKMLCLAEIYANSNNEALRQRAFVGCIAALNTPCNDVLDILSQCHTFAKDLQETVLQMLSCSNARKDSEEIRQNIMPDLIKNQPFIITKNGIIEKEEENDIIDIHADDRRMEKMEESIRKMVGMQKKGSDIFFEGFSQMKRFPFYNKLVNWFIPFTPDHPDIKKEMESLRHSEFVDRVMKQGPFCDSDKYSFVIAISSVISHLPEKVREMMESGEMGPLGMKDNEDTATDSSFIRLRYLQDLYRFYTLHSLGKALHNPFANAHNYHAWGYSADYLSDEVRNELCSYIFSKSKNIQSETFPDASDALQAIISSFKDKDSFFSQSNLAYHEMAQENYSRAIPHFLSALKAKPNDPSLMRGIARAYFTKGDYAHAAFYYDALHTLFPKRNSYVLNYAMAMVHDGMAEDILQDLYKMDYEQPDNDQIQSTLAWALLYAKKPEQALSLYEKISSRRQTSPLAGGMEVTLGELINTVYAYIFSGKVPQAVKLLDDYAATLPQPQRKTFSQDLCETLIDDEELLMLYDFGDAERDILSSRYI